MEVLTNLPLSKAFINEVKLQFESYVQQKTGCTLDHRFFMDLGELYLDAEQPYISADLIMPNNSGYQGFIQWRIEQEVPLEHYTEENNNIQFYFQGFDINLIPSFCKPRRRLPFKTKKYHYVFNCMNYSDFNEIVVFFEVHSTWNEQDTNTLDSVVSSVISNHPGGEFANYSKAERKATKNNTLYIWMDDISLMGIQFITHLLDAFNEDQFKNKILTITIE